MSIGHSIHRGLRHLTTIHSNHVSVVRKGNDQAIAAPGERVSRMPPYLHITRQTATAAVRSWCHCWFVHAHYILQDQQKTNTSQESLQSTRTATASRQPQHQVPATAPAVAPVPPKDAFDIAYKAVGSVAESNNRAKQDEQARTIARGVDRKGLEMQQIRRWNVGDVYAPHDLSGVEQSKWKRLKQSPRPKWDVLDQLNLNPMDHYKVSCAGASLENRGMFDVVMARKLTNVCCRTSASCPNMLRRWARSSTTGTQAFDRSTSARWPRL